MRPSVLRGLVLAAVVGLAACTAPAAPSSSDAPPGPLVPPVVSGEYAPTAEVDPAVLPYGYDDRLAVGPGWASAPETADDVFVGTGAPDASGMVPLIAVDSAGTLLWRAEVPQHADIDLSRTGESALVVMTVPTETGGWAASAFELRSGQLAWGPVAAPGAPADPGLLVATPEGLAAIDPASGATTSRRGSEVVLAERDGTVVSQLGGDLTATRDGGAVWTASTASLSLPDGAMLAVVPGSTSPDGTLVLGAADHSAPRTGTLVDLADGTPISTEVSGAQPDIILDALITAGDEALSALDDDGSVLWTREVPAGARLAAVDGVLAYLRVGDEVLVVNTATGADAVAYDEAGSGGLAVPAVVAQSGAVALNTGTWVLLPADVG